MAYDIHIQPVPSDQVVGFHTFSFGFTAALKVQGLQSLVNRWARLFMTPKGSDITDFNAGTEYAALIGGNIPRGSNELIDIISVSVEDTNEQVKQQDLDDEYASDEQLETAELTRFNRPTADSVEIWVTIKNVEQSALTVRLADLTTR